MPGDPRTNPFRADGPSDREAPRHLEVAAGVLALRALPQPDAPQVTEALHGERVDVYEEIEGWAWGQLAEDRYVGWMGSDGLRPRQAEPGHKIAALRSFLYPGPSIKLPPAGALPFGAQLNLLETLGNFVRTVDGFLWSRHVVPLKRVEDDFVAVAERFLGVPYLWGGKTPLGLDCSGLVQVALAATGLMAPRDSDLQERDLGRLVPQDELGRGDLVFWRGHVGIMRDAEHLLHANGDAMAVTIEPLASARARIAAAGSGPVTAIKRL